MLSTKLNVDVNLLGRCSHGPFIVVQYCTEKRFSAGHFSHCCHSCTGRLTVLVVAHSLEPQQHGDRGCCSPDKRARGRGATKWFGSGSASPTSGQDDQDGSTAATAVTNSDTATTNQQAGPKTITRSSGKLALEKKAHTMRVHTPDRSTSPSPEGGAGKTPEGRVPPTTQGPPAPPSSYPTPTSGRWCTPLHTADVRMVQYAETTRAFVSSSSLTARSRKLNRVCATGGGETAQGVVVNRTQASLSGMVHERCCYC